MHPGVRGGAADGRIVRPAVGGELDLCVVDAVEFQGSEGVPADTDGGAQRVVGRARDGEHRLPRRSQREHRGTQGVGAVDKAETHQRALGAEDLRIDLIKRFTAQIVIAVAGGPGKAGVGDALVLKGGHNAQRVLLRYAVDLAKALFTALFGALSHGEHFGTDIGNLHGISFSFVVGFQGRGMRRPPDAVPVRTWRATNGRPCGVR